MELRVVELAPLALVGNAFSGEEPFQDADCFVLAIAQKHVIDAESSRVGGQGAGACAENHAPESHVVELHDPLRDVERVVVGQRNDTCAKSNAAEHVRSLVAGGGPVPRARAASEMPNIPQANKIGRAMVSVQIGRTEAGPVPLAPL